MSRAFVRRSLAVAAFATLLGSVAGCGVRDLPPAAAVPPLPAAQGIRIVLYLKPGEQDPDGRFGAALAQELNRAGFRVISPEEIERRHGDPTEGRQPYDFALEYYRYFRSPERSEWFLRPHTAAGALDPRDVNDDRGPNWAGSSWAARWSAASGGHGWPVPFELPPEMQACQAGWKATHPELPSVPPVGATYELNGGIGVVGPPQGAERPDTDTRAARILVGTFTRCPTFGAAMWRIVSSGVGAATPMESLPTQTLVNLCRASTLPESRSVPGTGAVHTLDDACTFALVRDPRLAGVVRDVRAERAANDKELTDLRREERREQREQERQRARDAEQEAGSQQQGAPSGDPGSYGDSAAAAPAGASGAAVVTGAGRAGPARPAAEHHRPPPPPPSSGSDCPAGQTRMCGRCRPAGTKVYQCAAM